jgi:hypothetical protein
MVKNAQMYDWVLHKGYNTVHASACVVLGPSVWPVSVFLGFLLHRGLELFKEGLSYLV